MAEAPEGFNLLPAELLVRVLQHVPAGQRLGVCAAVSTTWHAAALTATKRLDIARRATYSRDGDKAPCACTTKLMSLPPWLQKYGAAAGLSALEIEYSSQNPDSCRSLSSALGAALPALEHLTALELSGSWQEPVLEHLSSLHHLQDLVLVYGIKVDHIIIKALPVTLTSLVFRDSTFTIDEDGDEEEPLPKACTLHHLTNLQRLSVKGRCTSISFADVAKLLQLRTFFMRPDRPTFRLILHSPMSELASMTGLQHLDLRTWMSAFNSRVELSAADCAAVTASSQLTYLNLSLWQLAPWQCSAVFPAGRKLPNLQELHVGPSFLHSPAATAALCSCCPNLTSLYVECLDMNDIMVELDSQFEQFVTTTACLDGLQQVSQLQELQLQDMRLKDPSMWGVLSCLTTLTGLTISSVSIPCLPGILQLTALPRLRKSEVEVAYHADDGFASATLTVAYTRDDNESEPVPDALDIVSRFYHLPLGIVKCTSSLFDEAVQAESQGAVELLADVAPAVCQAAIELQLHFEELSICGIWCGKTEKAALLMKVLERKATAFERVCEQQIDIAGSFLRAQQASEQVTVPGQSQPLKAYKMPAKMLVLVLRTATASAAALAAMTVVQHWRRCDASLQAWSSRRAFGRSQLSYLLTTVLSWPRL